jgi:hypothetical protein
MATFNSLQMTPPTYPVSGPTGDGRSIQGAHGTFVLGTQSPGAIASGDTVRMFRVHRNFLVKNGFLKWDALGAGVTIALGDAGDPTRYFPATAAASAGSTNALDFKGRDFNNAGFTTVILTIGGANTAATGTIIAELNGVIENPA